MSYSRLQTIPIKKIPLLGCFIFCLFVLPFFSVAQEDTSSNEALTVDKLTRQKELLRTRLYELVQENKDLKDKLNILQGKAGKFDDMAVEKELTIQNLFAEKDRLVAEITKLQEENAELSNNIEEKQTIIRAGREQIQKEFDSKV